ncbi:MAG: hydrogenase maturation protease [Anaerolineaceae bacterium]|nr:hydrogenase maturation protease [Anaerolineaceae bacterium]
MQSIVIGLGNPILGDDGIGCRVAEEVEKRFDSRKNGDSVNITPFYRGGIALMELLVDYDRAIIIDSIQGMGVPLGTVKRLTIDDIPTMTADSPHDISLKGALTMGEALGVKLPSEIIIIGIESIYQIDFSEEFSPAIAESLEPAVELVLNELLEN